MALNIEDVYRQLVVILLKGPRYKESEENPIYLRSAKILGEIGYGPASSPVNGVSLKQEENKEMAIYVFLEEEVKGLLEFIIKEVNIEQFPIRQKVIGKTRVIGRPAVGGESLGEGQSGGRKQ